MSVAKRPFGGAVLQEDSLASVQPSKAALVSTDRWCSTHQEAKMSTKGEAEETREIFQEAKPLNHCGPEGVMSTGAEAERNRKTPNEADQLSKSELDGIEFTWFNGFTVALSFVSYLFDVVSDGYLAYAYYTSGHYSYFGWTLSFVLLPAIGTSILTLIMYRSQKTYSQLYKCPSPSKLQWAFRMFCVTLGISPLAWYVESLYNGFRYNQAKRQEKEGRTGSLSKEKAEEWRRQKESYAVFLYVNNRSTAVLRLIEAFSECGPQMMLQLYIMAQGTFDSQTVWRQWFSITTSTCSLAWAVASSRPFTQMLDVLSTKKEDPGWICNVILFFMHVVGIHARALAIHVFASAFGGIVWVVILIHFLVTFVYALCRAPEITFRQVEFKNQTKKFSSWERVPFLFLVSIVFVFTYMNNNRRLRMRYYYAVCFVENTIMMFMWFFSLPSASERGSAFGIITIHYVYFFTSVGFLAYLLKEESELNQFCRDVGGLLLNYCFSLLKYCKSSETVGTQQGELGEEGLPKLIAISRCET